jgi:hypothetical protein
LTHDNGGGAGKPTREKVYPRVGQCHDGIVIK